MATQLWKSSRAADWDAQWQRYRAVVASMQKDKLVELDAWIQDDLPTLLHDRDPAPFLTQKELVHLMEWKLKKGKWRPQLMKFVESLSDATVRSASTKALQELASGDGDDVLKSAIQALAELKGVGPATASAVLAAYDPKAPFMGDEALEAIAHVIGARKYTLAHYMAFAAELAAKAKWLTKQSGGASAGKDDDSKWSPQRVQLCLYAAAHDKQAANAATTTTAPATKRSAATAAADATAKATTKTTKATTKATAAAKTPATRARTSSRDAAARQDDAVDDNHPRKRLRSRAAAASQ